MKWLAENAPKSAEDEFTKPCRVTARHIKEDEEIILKLFYLARSLVFKRKDFEQTKSAKISQA